MKIRHNAPPPASFQLAPMIDIVFLLLIFFLVTWQLSEKETEIDISVPTSTEGADSVRVANEIVINLSADGTITVNDQAYTKAELRSKLEAIVAAAEIAGKGGADKQPVRIRTDGSGDNQTLIDVVSEVRKAGIWNIGFAVKAPKN